MPVEIKDLNDGFGNIISCRGIVTKDELISVLKKHFTQSKEKFKRYRYNLSDFTEVTEVDLPTEAIILMADLCKSAARVNPETIVALVADQDLIYGLTRMFQTLIDVGGWEHGTFRNREDAESWVEKRVVEKYGINDLKIG